MSEKEFWRCTPRKLAALLRVYFQLHAPKDDAPQVTGPYTGSKKGYIDQVF